MPSYLKVISLTKKKKMNKAEAPHLLLVNPYIHDFSAFDLWAKPLGLLYLGGLLRSHGYTITFLDCLDPHFFLDVDPRLSPPRKKPFGTGKYLKQLIPKPPPLREIPKRYYRFGVPPEIFRESLKKMIRPQAALITSVMTYWYEGVRETTELIRSVFPDVPVLLGGIYAGLLPDHARQTIQPDYLITGPGERAMLKWLTEITGRKTDRPEDLEDPDRRPYPALDLYPRLPYAVLMTSWGCPFRCPYCASRVLQPRFRQRSPQGVVEEILYWHHNRGVTDFAFYDDALLVGFENHLGRILEEVLRRGLTLRFHAPNALHIREINRERAALLHRAGFKTIRLGLETTDWKRQREWGAKAEEEDFHRAVNSLGEAGYAPGEIEVYLLVGLPGQTWQEMERSIGEVKELGLRIRLAEYSPLPQTPLWEEACRTSRFPLREEPLFHNNSLYPCLQPFSWEAVQRLKDSARFEGSQR
jgi:hypothetical protein